MMSREQLENVQAPVLLIAGTRDLVKVSHSRLMARLIPRAQLVLIKGATHTSMFGRKAFYLKIIHDFSWTNHKHNNKPRHLHRSVIFYRCIVLFLPAKHILNQMAVSSAPGQPIFFGGPKIYGF